MSATPQGLSEKLKTEGEKTRQFFLSLPEAAWEATVYAEGACWSLAQVLAHFVSAEASFGSLIDDILAGGPGASDDFDIDRFNASQVQGWARLSPTELIEQFSYFREENCARVARMTGADLEAQGRHPFLGVAPLHEIIKLIYRHNGIHLRDARRILPGDETDGRL